MSGAEIAQKMLEDHFTYDVCTRSRQLTDHYNPANKTVNLSPEAILDAVLPPPP